MSFVHDLVARNHIGIYVHVATSVFHVAIYGAIRFNTRSNMGQQKH
jgi:hypothetical protein